MNRLIRCLPVMVVICFFAACSKNGSGNESLLYGKWIKAGTPTDTLHFYRQNGKNLFARKMSFSVSTPVTSVDEYKIKNGVLYIVFSSGSGTDEFPIGSFKWLQLGKQFEMHGNDRFPFLSSIQPVYVYTKLP